MVVILKAYFLLHSKNSKNINYMLNFIEILLIIRITNFSNLEFLFFFLVFSNNFFLT